LVAFPSLPEKGQIGPCGAAGIADFEDSAMLWEGGDIDPTFSGRIHDAAKTVSFSAS
jgi:hypothetical protein